MNGITRKKVANKVLQCFFFFRTKANNFNFSFSTQSTVFSFLFRNQFQHEMKEEEKKEKDICALTQWRNWMKKKPSSLKLLYIVHSVVESSIFLLCCCKLRLFFIYCVRVKFKYLITRGEFLIFFLKKGKISCWHDNWGFSCRKANECRFICY